MPKMNWIELATKYGGYMETDKSFLENRLLSLSEEEKAGLLTPPPSVINAYFSELYQKRNPREATDYFFKMSQAFGMFFDKPEFGLEGKKGFETFRFIRLNIDGKAYGYCYINADGEAVVFSELPQQITQKFLFNLAQIFPHYIITNIADEIHMKPQVFDDFIKERDLTPLTQAAENEDYLKFYGYNLDDVIEQAEQCFTDQTLLQFQGNQFIIYQRKG